MRCPSCGSPDIRVIDSRAVSKSNAIRRRRECSKCLYRFTTYEFVTSSRIIVQKTDGSQEEFSREKLIRSIQLPCTKRPVSTQAIELIADEIENNLENNNRKEISSKEIGEMVMNRLKKLDHIAYIRFASVYREFKDVTEFKTEVEGLVQEKDEQ